MKKTMGIVVVCFSFMVMPFAAQAQKAASAPGAGGPVMTEDMKIEKEIGISPEQHKKMQDLSLAARTKEKALKDETDAKRSALKQELEQDKINRAKIDGLIADIKEAQGKILEARVDLVIGTREIMTPEQYKKFKEWRKNFSNQNSGMKEKMRENVPAKKQSKAKK